VVEVAAPHARLRVQAVVLRAHARLVAGAERANAAMVVAVMPRDSQAHWCALEPAVASPVRLAESWCYSGKPDIWSAFRPIPRHTKCA